MGMNVLVVAVIASALALTLIVPYGAVAQDQQMVWAQSQQTALAEEILGCDGKQCWAPVFVAEALGPSRMSEDVQVALIGLMERLSDEQDVALANGTALEYVVNGEFFMHLARVVATLDDPRAIPVLVRVGDYMYSRYAAHGLASFGEQALPAILDVIDTPGVSNDVVEQNVLALSMMVEDAGANGLSDSARREVVRVAGDSLRSQSGSVVLKGIDLAIALNEPHLMQMVRDLSQDTSELISRGVSQSTSNLIRKKVIESLAETSR